MQYGTAKLVLDEKKNPPGPGSTITSDYARVVSIRSLIESDIADIGNKYYEDHDTKLLIDPRDIEVGSDDDRARLQANDDSSWAGLGSTGKWYSLPIHVPGLKKVSETCASHNEIPCKTEHGDDDDRPHFQADDNSRIMLGPDETWHAHSANSKL